jgi:hypothetical protein
MGDICKICKSELPDECPFCPVCGQEINPETPVEKSPADTARDLHGRGTNHLKQGDIRSALPLLEGAVRITPEEPRFWNSLGVCQYRAGMNRKAEGSFQKAVELRPSVSAYRKNLEKAMAEEKGAKRPQKPGKRIQRGMITGVMLSFIILAAFFFFILVPALTHHEAQQNAQESVIQVNRTEVFLNEVIRIAGQDRPADFSSPPEGEYGDERVKDLFNRFEHSGMNPVILIGTGVPVIRSMDDLGDPWVLVGSSDGLRAQVSLSGDPVLIGDHFVVRGVLVGSPGSLDYLRALGAEVDNETRALHQAIVQYNETVLYGTGTSLYWYESDAGTIADREGAVVRRHDESLAAASQRLTEFLQPVCLNTTVNISHGETRLARPPATPLIDHNRRRAYTLFHESLESIQRGDERGVEIAMGTILEVVSPLPPEERAFFQDSITFVMSLTDAVRLTKDNGEPGGVPLQDVRDDLARAAGSVKKAEQILPLLNASGYIGSSDKDLIYETISLTKSRICQKAERWQVPFYNPDCSSVPVTGTVI